MRLPCKQFTVNNKFTGYRNKTYDVQGSVVDAPMGVGKTVMMARTAVGIGIGKPDPTAKDPSRKRALILTFWQNQNNQLTGKAGDNTFRRFAGDDMNVTALFEHEENVEGDAVVVSAEMLMRHLRDGKLLGQEFDVLMVDEAQHLMGPKLQHIILEHWRGPILGYTATPAYCKDKDLRKFLPYHIKHADMLTAIDDGMTNGVQLFSVRVGGQEFLKTLEGTGYEELSAEELRDNAVEDFAVPLLHEGRRGMIFCERGDRGKHAVAMAARFDGMELPDGRIIVARALSAYNPATGPNSNAAIIREYNEGNVDILTTTHLGTESLNADIDMVLFACDINSWVKLLQAIGRGTRLSERFDTTVYAEFLLAKSSKTRSIYEAFLCADVEQGVVIRSRKARGRAHGYDPAARPWRGLKHTVLPVYLQKALQEFHHKPLGFLLLRRGLNQEPVPAGYKLLDDIIAGKNVRRSVAKRRIEDAGYHYVDRFARGAIQRYYEPNTVTFFDDDPILPATGDDEFTAYGWSDRLGMHGDRIKYYADLHGIEGRPRTGPSGEERTFTEKEIRELETILAKELPWGTPADRTTTQLDMKHGTTEGFFRVLGKRFGIHAKFRRYRERTPDTPAAPSLSGQEVAQLEAYYTSFPHADPTDKILDQIAKASGMNPKTFAGAVTDQDRALSVKKWFTYTEHDGTEKTKLLNVWSEANATAMVQRITRSKAARVLSEDRIIPRALSPLFIMSADSMVEKMRSQSKQYPEDTIIKRTLGFTNTGRCVCVTWPFMAEFIKQNESGLRPGAPRLAVELFPTGPDDTDEKRLAYARYIQARFVDPYYLGFDPAEVIATFEEKYPELKIV